MPSPADSKAVAGLLLTGGASRRMGCDKALVRVDGEPLAVRLGRALAAVTGPACEIGPGHSGLTVVAESTPGAGPLAALSDGVAALSDGVAAVSDGVAALSGGGAGPTDGVAAPADGVAAPADGVAAPAQVTVHQPAPALTGPVIVLACDLPRLDEATLRRLAEWPGAHSVVPLWRGRPQPLCARWAAADLARVGAMVAAGQRSLRGLLALPNVELTTALGDAVADADTPEELDALGISWRPPS